MTTMTMAELGGDPRICGPEADTREHVAHVCVPGLRQIQAVVQRCLTPHGEAA